MDPYLRLQKTFIVLIFYYMCVQLNKIMNNKQQEIMFIVGGRMSSLF